MHLHCVSESRCVVGAVLTIIRVGGIKMRQIQDAGIEGGSGQPLVFSPLYRC